LGEAAGSSCPAAISGCAAAVNRGGYRACGRGSRCARCSARRCARNGWRQSAPRRRSPSVIAALPPPPLAENLPRLPSPTARPAPISLRSSGPLSVQVEVSQLHLTAWPDGHLNYTHPYTAERPENSTTSVDANSCFHTSTSPLPSHTRILTRSARRLRNTSTAPLKGILSQRLSGQRRQRIGAPAEVDRPRCDQHLHAGRNRDHRAAFTARSTSRRCRQSTPGATRITVPVISISTMPDGVAADGAGSLAAAITGTNPSAPSDGSTTVPS